MRKAALILSVSFIVAPEAQAQVSSYFISRGTTMCVVDVGDLGARESLGVKRCVSNAYLPPGTVIRSGTEPNALITATGLIGRRSDKMRLWDETAMNSFRAVGLVAFIAQDGNLRQKSLDGQRPCKLTRGEWYKAGTDPNDGESLVLTLASRSKPECVEAGKELKVSFPRVKVTLVRVNRTLVEQLDESGQRLSLDIVYRTRLVDKAFRYVKQCGETIDEKGTVKVTGGVNINLSGILRFGGINAGAEGTWERAVKRSSPATLQEEMAFYYYAPAGNIVGTPNQVAISKKKVCQNSATAGYTVPRNIYSYYIAASGMNADLDPSHFAESKVRLNPSTQVPQITCALDYFSIRDILRQDGYAEEDIPFLISRIAEIPRFGADADCSI